MQDFCFRVEKLSIQGLNEAEINSLLISELEQLINRENPTIKPKDITMNGFINVIWSDVCKFVLNFVSARRQAMMISNFKGQEDVDLSIDCPSFCSIIQFPDKIDLNSDDFILTYNPSDLIQVLLCDRINLPSIITPNFSNISVTQSG